MRAAAPWLRPLPTLVLYALRQKYAGSALGALWAVAGPLVEVMAYAVLFGALLAGGTSASWRSYVLFVATGLLPWAALRESLEAAAGLLPSHRWIRRSRVPFELLVAREVLVAHVRAAFAVAVVIVGGWVLGSSSGLAWLLPLAALALQIATAVGLALMLAPLGTLFPDLRPGLTSTLVLLTFASPIVYAEGHVGAAARAWLEWNPYTHLLRLFRAPVEATAGWRELAFCALGAAAVMGVGLALRSALFAAARDRL
jgi:ABC-type polysaccharide/polyol phosphate export permease